MSFGQSPHLILQVMNRAFGRFTHVIGYVLLVGVALEALGYLGGNRSGSLWPALAAILFVALALVVLDRRRTTAGATGFLVIGGASIYWFALTVFENSAPSRSTDAAPITMLKVVIILVCSAGENAWWSIGWWAGGFVVAEGVAALAAWQTGAAIRPDATTIVTEAGLILLLVVVGTTGSRLQGARPHLHKAAMDERASAIRYRIEAKAAAVMHDTVLSHLSAVVHADVGRLHPELKRQMETDLELLIGEEWLSDPSPDVDSRARADWRRSQLLAAVREMRDQSLTVEVTGDLAVVGRLTPERDTAIGLAVKQCLVNVLNHAEVRAAEVVIIGSDREVSVMVIDAGRGFSEALVGADRLGLRQSVRHRIESVGGSVQIWSTKGRGTSVMIRVPASELLQDELVDDEPIDDELVDDAVDDGGRDG